MFAMRWDNVRLYANMKAPTRGDELVPVQYATASKVQYVTINTTNT
jgi:hypothetical protein